MSIIKTPEILMPNQNIDLQKWATIACDQYTSQKDYWDTLNKLVGDSPSTLKVTFSEIYLSSDNTKKIKEINDNMQAYLNNNILQSIGNCFVLIDRQTKINPHRLGLIASIDLEAYSWKFEDKALICATEGTVIERIPPRVQIRQNAPVEFPHIMLLFDDRKEKIIENLYASKNNFEKIYDFDLNMDGGHIVGYKIENTDSIIKKFDSLLDTNYLNETFHTTQPIQFAVGDGNHSLATAKTHWENIKSTLTKEEQQNHPARFALVELINIHDVGIVFEPIYRVVFNAENDFVDGLETLFNSGIDYNYIIEDNIKSYKLCENTPLAIKAVQDYIDNYKKTHNNFSVDYIHGIDNLKQICKDNKNAIGITLPTVKKTDLFEYVLKNGPLPRKSFSMGEAFEKRYYIESKKIK